MNRKALVGLIVVVAVVVIAIIALRTIPQPASGEIKIGGVYALTGKGASFGKDVQRGVNLAVEEVNAAGGISGKTLVVAEEDTQSEAKHAVTAFEKLIAMDGIPVAVGFITSSEAMACAAVAERAKVVMVTPIAGTPKLKEAGDYIFRTRESGLEQGFTVARYVYEEAGTPQTAVLTENAANALGYRNAFVERFKELGGEIVADLTYDEGQTDVRAVLTQIKAANPPALYMPGVGKVLGRVVLQARELGLTCPIYSSAGIEDPALFELAGDSAEGIVYAAPAFSTESERAATKRFVEAYTAKYGAAPSVYAANAYDALMLVAKALQAQGTSADGIRDYLYGVEGYEGASGSLTFDEFGEVSKPVVMKVTASGGFSVLDEAKR
jgi:branched-chain amino acid transport system substrate-binding protein